MTEQDVAGSRPRATSALSARSSTTVLSRSSKAPLVRGVASRDPSTKILARIADRKAAAQTDPVPQRERVPLQEKKTLLRSGSVRRNSSVDRRPATNKTESAVGAAVSKSASTSPVPDDDDENILEMPLSKLLNPPPKTASSVATAQLGRLVATAGGSEVDREGGAFFQERGAGLEVDDGKSTVLQPQMVEEAVLQAGVVDTGKLLHLDLTGQFIARICGLSKCHQLRTLDLSFNRIRVIEGIDTLYQLRDLRFTCNKIERLCGLQKLSALETLHVQVNRIAHIGRGALSTQKRLRDLRLDGNQIMRLCNLDAQVQLTHLDVSQNRLSRIEGLGLMGQLESLNLSFNEIERMEGLTAFGRLRELNLASNRLTAVDALKHCGSLQVLRLDSNNLADLSGLIRMPRLAEFYAAENARLTTAAHDVAQSLPGLEFLDLAGCGIAGLYELEALAGLTALIELRLAGNPVTEKQGYAAWARGMTSLDALDAVDVRAERRRASRPPSADSEEAEVREDEDASGAVLDRGGVAVGKARVHKELAEVLSIEDFEGVWHRIRDGLTSVKEGLLNGIFMRAATDARPEALEAPEPDASRRPASMRPESRPASMRLGDQPSPKKSPHKGAGGAAGAAGAAGAGTYARADEAVARVLGRRRAGLKGPSLREMMARKEREREEDHARMAAYRDLAGADRSVYVYRHMFDGEPAMPAGAAGGASAHASASAGAEDAAEHGVPVAAARGEASGEAQGPAAQGPPAARRATYLDPGGEGRARAAVALSDEEDEGRPVPDAMAWLQAQLAQRMAETREQLRAEEEADEGGAPSAAEPPASPLAFPLKEQRDEERRAIRARDEQARLAALAAAEAVEAQAERAVGALAQRLADDAAELAAEAAAEEAAARAEAEAARAERAETVADAPAGEPPEAASLAESDAGSGAGPGAGLEAGSEYGSEAGSEAGSDALELDLAGDAPSPLAARSPCSPRAAVAPERAASLSRAGLESLPRAGSSLSERAAHAGATPREAGRRRPASAAPARRDTVGEEAEGGLVYAASESESEGLPGGTLTARSRMRARLADAASFSGCGRRAPAQS